MDDLHLFARIVNPIPRSDVEKEALRDITNGVRNASGNLNHPGVRVAPSGNVTGYQNWNRNWTVWRDIYMRLHKSLGQPASGFCPNTFTFHTAKRATIRVLSTLCHPREALWPQTADIVTRTHCCCGS